MGIWNQGSHLFYLSSDNDHDKWLGGLQMTEPLHQPGEALPLQELADFYLTQPQGAVAYAPLYVCGGEAAACSPASFTFAITQASVSAVPEASTLSMLLAGIAGLGLAARRR